MNISRLQKNLPQEEKTSCGGCVFCFRMIYGLPTIGSGDRLPASRALPLEDLRWLRPRRTDENALPYQWQDVNRKQSARRITLNNNFYWRRISTC